MAKGKPNPFKNPDNQERNEAAEEFGISKSETGETINLDRRKFCQMLGALAAVAGAQVVGCGRAIGVGPEGCEGCDSGVEGCDAGPEGCEGCDSGVEGCDAGPEGCEGCNGGPEGCEGCEPEGCGPEGCEGCSYFA